jgi:hypothetical protein
MILIGILSFFAGFIAATVAHHLSHIDEIDRIKSDAKSAIEKQATESYRTGYMRCYAEENKRKVRPTDPHKTEVILISQ